MFITPDKYDSAPAETLLLDVSKGRVPFDHRLFKSLISRREETLAAIVNVGAGAQDVWRFDITEELINLSRHFKDPATIPLFLHLLKDEEPPGEVFDAFLSLGGTALEPLLAAYEAEKDDETRSQIAFALAALGVEDARVEAILKQRDPDEISLDLYQSRGEKAAASFDLFAEYEEEGLPIVETLTLDERFELLESENENYRTLAAASLFHDEFGEKGQNALFNRAKTDPSDVVRAHCWQALDNALDRDDIVGEMKHRLGDASLTDNERSGLLIGLSPLADQPEVRKAILAFYVRPETRLKAMEAMWRSLDPDFAEYFPEHLDDANVDIRRVALRGVGAQGLTSELGKVRKMISDETVREDALFAYAMAAPSKVSPAYLRTLYKKLEKEAGGFTEEEDEIVRIALDERLRAHNKPPAFSGDQNISEEE